MALDIYTAIGFVGMACIVAAYAYLTWQKHPNPWVLHGTNLIGAVLLAISPWVHTNWPRSQRAQGFRVISQSLRWQSSRQWPLWMRSGQS